MATEMEMAERRDLLRTRRSASLLGLFMDATERVPPGETGGRSPRQTQRMVSLCLALAFQAEMDKPLQAGTAIEFSAQTITGSEVKSSSLKGAPSVVILWGAWSQPSVRALEIGPAIAKEFPRVKVVALASGDDRDTALKAASATNLDLVFWWDPAGRNREKLIATTVFKTRRFPTIYVLDSQVKVVAGFLGYKSADRDALFAAIRAAN